MKKIIIFFLSFFVGIGLFMWVLNIVGWSEVKKIIFNFSGRDSLIILFITLLIWLVGFWKWQFVLHSQGGNYSKKTLLKIVFASNAVTYLLTPTAIFGGEGFRIYALHKKTAIPWGKNCAAIIIEKMLSASVAWFFLVSGLLSFLFLNQTLPRQVVLAAIIIIGGLSLGLFIFYSKSFKKESIFKLIWRFFGKEIKEGHITEDIEKEIFNFFDFRKKTMWQGLGIAFLRYSLVFSKCWLLIFFLTKEANIFIASSVMFFLYLAYSFPTPAGFGSLDVAEAFVFSSFGLGAATGVTFSFILRGAEVIISLIGIIVLIKLSFEIFLDNIKNFFQKIISK